MEGIRALREMKRTKPTGKLEIKHSRAGFELSESYTLETMKAIQQSIEKQIRKEADSYSQFTKGTGFEWHTALSGKEFDWEKIEQLMKPHKGNLRTYNNFIRQQTALYLYQWYKRYDRSGDLKKTLVYEMVSRFMEYAGLLDDLDSLDEEKKNKYNSSHHERGKNLVLAAQKLEDEHKATGGKLTIQVKYPW